MVFLLMDPGPPGWRAAKMLAESFIWTGRMLGKIEAFVRRKNEDDRIQVRNFDVALRELIHSAEQGNVTVAFNQMTTSCVACHVLLREGVD